jgi:ATP-dependent RNA helicase SUPV3L1/SUV3
MQQVVELGERLRAIRGGAAVVMGALSPRTRNAQVAMFQAGEVDCLVATDAIGMGLNLDIDHVAFAALRKFDGKEARELDAAELGQIAGRAGRHLHDGTFGALAPLAIPSDVEARLVAHRFDPIRRVRYRSSELDFASIESLGASLREAPRRRTLLLDTQAEDLAALDVLGRDAEVRALARDSASVALLWDVCRVPDFRKLLFESHVALLRELYLQLRGPRAALDEDWINATVGAIDDVTGDLDTLMARIASIRTWTYISNQSRWVRDAETWQARTRDVEDRLSDALHDKLVQRFVDRRAGGRPKRERASRPKWPALADAGPARDDHPFARLASLRLPGQTKAAPERADDAFVERVVAAPYEAFELEASGAIAFVDGTERRPLGRLVRGSSLLLPEVRLERCDELGAGARSRVHRRLVAWARDAVNDVLVPLRNPRVAALSASARGIVYQLERGLGTTLANAASLQIAELDDADRLAFGEIGVEIGRAVVFVPSLTKGKALARRAALVRAAFVERAPPLPNAGATSFRAGRFDPAACTAIGYPVFGVRAIRADIAERVAQGFRGDLDFLARRIGCPLREAESVAAALAPWHESDAESGSPEAIVR